MKKRGARTGKRLTGTRKRLTGTRKRVTGTRKRVTGTRKRVTGTGKVGGAGEKGRRRGNVMSVMTVKNQGRDVAATRRLAQAMAIRLGFKPETIGDIMGQNGLDNLPRSIRKSSSVIDDLTSLGQISSQCDNNTPIELGKGGEDRQGNFSFMTTVKSPLSVGANATASRHLLQAMALRLGFQPKTIRNIMGERDLKPLPSTILKNKTVKVELGKLGKLTGKCLNLTDGPLDTTDNNPDFKDFGNTGNTLTRIFNNKKKAAHYKNKLRNMGQ